MGVFSESRDWFDASGRSPNLEEDGRWSWTTCPNSGRPDHLPELVFNRMKAGAFDGRNEAISAALIAIEDAMICGWVPAPVP